MVCWAGGTLGILSYAVVDFLSHPKLQQETAISMTPNWEKLPDLAHWGGRLMHHSWPLLVINAIMLGGLVALVIGSLIKDPD